MLVDVGPEAITSLGIAAGFGFGSTLAITAFGHLTGGHFNPAVSAGLAIAGKFPARDVLPYRGPARGWLRGGARDGIVYSSEVMDSLHTQPGSGIDDWAALVLEIVATALFVMVILTVATDERVVEGRDGPVPHRPLHLHGGGHGRPGPGAPTTPRARSTLVLWNQEWSDVWIYIVGVCRRCARRRDLGLRRRSPGACLGLTRADEHERTQGAPQAPLAQLAGATNSRPRTRDRRCRRRAARGR